MIERSVLAIADLPPRLDYPVGWAPRMYHFLQTLAAQRPVDVHAIHRSNAPWEPRSFLPDGIGVRHFKCTSVPSNPLNEGSARGRLRRAAHYLFDQLPYLSHPRHLEGLDQHLRDRSYAVVVFFYLSTSHLGLRLPDGIRRIFVLDEGCERAWGDGAGFAGLKNRLLAVSERTRVHRLYQRIGKVANSVVAISRDEEAWLGKFVPKRVLVTIPHGIDCSYFCPIDAEEDIDVAVFGDLSQARTYGPARALFEATKHLTCPTGQRLRWAFVGRAPNPSITVLASPDTDVTGFVPDLRGFYARTKVAAAPAQQGTGVKTTVLQAWAMRRPLVATPFSVRGLPARDGENVLLADTPSAMAGRIAELLQSPDLRRRVAVSGWETVRRERDIRSLAQSFVDVCTAVT